MFIDTGKEKCGPECRPGCHCGKYIEIWNDVFMQYNKNEEGKFVPLGRHNVDTGMGVERTICMMSGAPTVYDTEIFAPIMKAIDEMSNVPAGMDPADVLKARRVIADHMRTATFILCDPKGGVKPGNVGANYVLRRLIRRAVRFARQLGIAEGFTVKMAEVVCEKYKHVYPELAENLETCRNDLAQDAERRTGDVEALHVEALAVLQIAVVPARHRMHHGERRGLESEDLRRLRAHELEDVGVELLRHDRRARAR